jgi:hypothetical protein
MGTLALIRAEQDGDVRYLECHVNLWNLGGLFRRAYFFDLGLVFTPAGESVVRELAFLLPCSADGVEPTDLSQILKGSGTASLVIGARVDPDDGSFVIHEPAGAKRWKSVRAKVELDKDLSTSELRDEKLSVWRMKLADAVQPGTQAYVRFRFRMPDPRRTWTWQMGKRTALIDLRFADVREAVREGSGARADVDQLSARFLPVEKLNMLVIAPASLQAGAVTPPLRYMRLFEGRVWEDYLDRAVGWRRSQNLVVYHWRWTSGDVAAIVPGPRRRTTATPAPPGVAPFRAFLVLGKDTGFVPVLTFLAALALLSMVFVPLGLSGTEAWAQSVVGSYGPWLAGFVGISALGTVLSLVAPIRRAWSRVPRAYTRVEGWIFRVWASV